MGDTDDRRRTIADALDGGRRPVLLNAWKGDGAIGGASTAERAFDRGALGTAAQLVGLGRRMLDLTVAYAIERKQFGVAIGTQQAVKHHLATAAMKLRFAAPVVYAAAWELSTGAPTARTARVMSAAACLST